MDQAIPNLRTILGDHSFLQACATRLSRPFVEIESRIQTSLSEAAVGLALLDDINLKGKRVLEIGAGIGIASLILHRRGVQVVPIEPGRGGFDANARIGFCLRDWLKVDDLTYLSLGAEELRP